MRFKGLAILAGLLLVSGTLSSQTIADVINKYNDGVSKLNAQEYDGALDIFKETLSLCDQVGAEADDMKGQVQNQIPSTYYRQAALWMKRKQYDKAIPYLENTITYSTEFNNNSEIAAKSEKFLQSLYIIEGNKSVAAGKLDEANSSYDKALALNPNLSKAYQGKAIVLMKEEDTEGMLTEFNKAKSLANAQGDKDLITEINSMIDNYYNPMIFDALSSLDEEDPQYDDVLYACDEAIKANDKNATAYYILCMMNNKMINYDAAVENGQKAAQYETDPAKLSNINYELGMAYFNNAEYDKSCEALSKVTEGDFVEKAEKKKASVPGCNL